MNTTVDRKELVRAITLASKAQRRACTLPVLSGVRIEANGRLEVAATDLELSIEAEIDCTTETDGFVIAPGNNLLKLVKAQKSETVTLKAVDGELHVNGARMKALAADDYPVLPGKFEADKPAETYRWPAQAFKIALERTIIAASTDECRQILTGILFDGDAGELAATDSYRLAVQCFGPVKNPGGQYVFPARAMKRVIAAIGKKTERLEVTFAATFVTFTIGDVKITTRLIEGEYVNYRQLIPAAAPNVLETGKAAFLESLAQVAPMAQGNLPVKLRLSASDVEISANTPDIGEAADNFHCIYTGDPMVVAFNPVFLEEGLKAMPGPTVRLEVSDGLKPALFTAPDDGYTYLLMPVRLS